MLPRICCALILTSMQVLSADGSAFEAASVKLASPDAKYARSGGPGTSTPGQFRASRESILDLLTNAFDVKADQVIGPAWLRASGVDYFSVAAVVPAGATKSSFRKCCRTCS